MKTPTSHLTPRFRAPRDQGGFALIVTVSLLVLLALVAVGLLSLSTITVRTANQGNLQNVARANARLSLLMALSDLQRLTGPDQRITSSARILGDPDSSGSEIARSHLTGVWKGWKWDGEGTARYESHKQDDFLGWLVSHPDPETLLAPEYARDSPPENAVRLVGDGSVPDLSDHVFAERVPIAGTNVSGEYAWAVLDQGQKACLTLPESDSRILGNELAELTSPPVPGFQSVGADGRDWKALHSIGDERLKLVSTGQVPLAGVERQSRTFHDLTPYSTGLAVNAAEGGLARDLSLLFDTDTLPKDYQRRFLYSDNDRPMVMPPSRFKGANVFPSPDPSWRLLQSHATLYKKLRDVDGTPAIGTSVIERPPAGMPPTRTLFHRSFHQQQVAPVIAKAQFIFSFGFGASPKQARGGKEVGQKSGENWVIWLLTDPVITLWNPYDVSLSFERARIDLHRIPLAFQVFRNGRSFAPPDPLRQLLPAGRLREPGQEILPPQHQTRI
jgi:hypothetical protein